jgi:hypothetical protein
VNRPPFFQSCLAAICFSAVSRAADLPALPAEALSGDFTVVKALREAGPAGLEALLKAAGPQVAELRLNKVRLESEAAAKLRAAVDGVAGQRDAWASGLYWFTDLEAAKAEAARTGRRILSLRLLGNLDEEYCCANSRFFRTVLYANQAVSKVLRDRYVLHWKSVRPVPLLTIDMGDGRRIKRTITGNSIHYVLNAEGTVIDALPGIYSPAAFLSALDRIDSGVSGKSPEEMRRWHGGQAHLECMEWLAAAGQAGVYGDEVRSSLAGPDKSGKVLTALAREAFPAGNFGSQDRWVLLLDGAQQSRFDWAESTGSPDKSEVPLSGDALLERLRRRPKIETIKIFPFLTEFDPPKGMVERPILKQTVPDQKADETATVQGVRKKALPGNATEALDPASPAQSGPSLAGRMTQAAWADIAAPVRQWVRLDEASRRMMLQKLPEGVATAAEFESGQAEHDATAFGRMLSRFEEAIARDMVRNEYFYHALIHQWLEEDKEGTLAGDVEVLNRRVYQELFLTPDYDAWLGLVPEDTYTGIEKDGCACDKGAPPMRQSK